MFYLRRSKLVRLPGEFKGLIPKNEDEAKLLRASRAMWYQLSDAMGKMRKKSKIDGLSWIFRFFIKKSPKNNYGKNRPNGGNSRKNDGNSRNRFCQFFWRFWWHFFAIICWPSGSKRRMRNQSFLSSSSTLGEGLEVMSRPVDDLVGTSFPLDGEERALRARLEDIWAWSVLWLQVGDNLWLFFSMICWEYSRIKHLSTLTTLSHCIPLCCSRKSMASWMPSSPPRLRSHMWHLQRQDMGVE